MSHLAICVCLLDKSNDDKISVLGAIATERVIALCWKDGAAPLFRCAGGALYACLAGDLSTQFAADGRLLKIAYFIAYNPRPSFPEAARLRRRTRQKTAGAET